VLVAGDGVPDQDLQTLDKEGKQETMAASERKEAVAIVALQGEASGRDTIGGLQSW
jgi:hypothetical protein